MPVCVLISEGTINGSKVYHKKDNIPRLYTNIHLHVNTIYTFWKSISVDDSVIGRTTKFIDCMTSTSIWKYLFNKSNTECGIIRPTNAIYMGWHSLLGSKAISKCEVNPTSSFEATVFTSNIPHRVQYKSSNSCGSHLVFRRTPQINSVWGLSGIKAI